MFRKYASLIATIALVAVSSLGIALVSISNTGQFPSNWPVELHEYREFSQTYQVAHGIQEDLHLIPFTNREEFEKAWPVILSVKTPGAPLILMRPDSFHSTSGSTLQTGVAIVCPPDSVRDPEDITKPLIDSLDLDSDKTPEYMIRKNDQWVTWTEDGSPGFRYRARTDIILIVDGDIVDLNRIKLPENTPVIDKRFD